MHPKRILTAFAVLAATAGLVTAAASAEPKNQWPFTRPVSSRVLEQVVTFVPATAVPAGEPKNEAPFTNRVSADPGYATALHAITAYYSRPQSSALIRPAGKGVGGSGFAGTAAALLVAVVLGLGASGLAFVRRRSLRLS